MYCGEDVVDPKDVVIETEPPVIPLCAPVNNDTGKLNDGLKVEDDGADKDEDVEVFPLPSISPMDSQSSSPVSTRVEARCSMAIQRCSQNESTGSDFCW